MALCILGILTAIMLPQMTWNKNRHEVDVLTREIAIDLQRMRQYSLTSGMAQGNSWTLSLQKNEYVIMERYIVHKRRAYPDGVVVPLEGTRKDIKFDGKGRPQNNMQITVAEREGTYQHRIIVAVQTGRIRIE